MSHKYFVKVVQNEGGKGGKEGRVATLTEPNNPNFPPIIVQSPGEFKGPVDANGKSLAWTPEDIFIASAAVCFFTTFVSIAENSKLEYTSFSITAEGILDKVESIGEMITEITLKPVLTLKNKDSSLEKAKKILEKVENNCLIAKSMKSKIILQPEIK